VKKIVSPKQKHPTFAPHALRTRPLSTCLRFVRSSSRGAA
jgi:hypothetical protein